MVLPAAPNMVFLTSRGDLTKHSGLASANQIQYFKCMNGLCFSAVRCVNSLGEIQEGGSMITSLSLPHHRRDNGTPGAVSNGSGCVRIVFFLTSYNMITSTLSALR